jgi:hypothetical protein
MNTELPHELAQYKAPLDTLQAVQAVALAYIREKKNDPIVQLFCRDTVAHLQSLAAAITKESAS